MRKLLFALALLVPALAGAQAVLTPEQQLQQAQQALEQARQALEQAEKAKQQAEKAVETQRQSEAVKAKTDSLRRETERIKAETERMKAETERIKAETDAPVQPEPAATPAAKPTEWQLPSAQAQAPKKNTAKLEEKKKDKTDPKYLDGAVTTDAEGKIVFKRFIPVSGHSADELYNAALTFMQQLVSSDNQLDGSRLALVNPTDHSLVATVKENMLFSSSAISIDQTEADYVLIVKCGDRGADVEISHIAFNYEPGRPSGFREKAENVISDKMAMNKKHTALNRIFGKFRRGTVDRVDQITRQLADALQF